MIIDIFINVKYYPLKVTSLSYYLIISMIVLRIMNYERMGKSTPVTIAYKASEPIVIIKTKKKEKTLPPTFYFSNNFDICMILCFYSNNFEFYYIARVPQQLEYENEV